MHLEIQREQLEYLMKVVKVFKTKCKTKSTVLYLVFKDDCSEFIYSSEGFFIKLKVDYVAEFKGKFSLDLGFIANILTLFDNKDIIEIDFRDKLIVAHQKDTTLKGQVAGSPNYESFIIDESQLEEVPIPFTLSNKLLALNLEELGITAKDPYVHLYNVKKDKLIKMSSFCALIQTLDNLAQCETTLTQDVLSVCSVIDGDVQYFKYYNSFYIKGDEIEVKMPLANIQFPSLDIIINKVKSGCENFLLKSADMLDICEKCCNLNLDKKVNRTDVVFKGGFIMYSYNNILTGSVESGLDIDWKMSFNPLLMRSILKYIDEECVIVSKNNDTRTILISNLSKTTTFMLALCK